MSTGAEDVGRLESAPDAYRSRAHSMAALVTTGAAAIAAGALFGGAELLPSAARIGAVVAVALLLISDIFFVAAGLHARNEYVRPSELKENIKGIVARIVFFMRVASGAALLATAALFVVVVDTVLDAGRSIDARIAVSEEGLAAMTGACLATDERVLIGRIQRSQLAGDSPLVEVTTRAGSCGDEAARIWLRRDSVEAAVEVD